MFQLFHLTQNKGNSLQKQLREQIATAILNGNIPLDVPLPSSRKLAQQLGIARNTVVLAYEHLLDDGYLIARERRGYFVNPDILAGQVENPAADQTPQVRLPDWEKRFKVHPSAQRNIVKAQDWQSYDYPFIYGQFDEKIFPSVNWRECCRDAASDAAVSDWAADSMDHDDPRLIEQIRTRLLPRRGVWASQEQILVTVGSQQSLFMLVQLLLDKHSVLGLEEPGYVDVRNIASLHQCQIKPLAIDQQGLIVDDQLNQCDLIYTTPSHQCPTAVTMPIERRYELLRKACEEDFLIIEDDYESETNFDSKPNPALKSLDNSDRVIYIGSLSKTLAPGLRLGYVVASERLIEEARALRRLMIRHPASNNQRAAAFFLERGYHDALVMNIARNYQARWRAMNEALTQHLPDSHDTPTFGGSCYWVRGPEGLDAAALKQRAMADSILIEPGKIHFYQHSSPDNYFRLGFSSISTDRIAPGIRKLAGIIREMVPD
ncbi:MocR-like pyridoxine biosynthesis transcription factor PdxR [Oceanospirillum sediminis]|uniref:PLP-dependent aminotransferase family protein n=1 Tax=Oceanospirillum sediminis TaxID=2760088 RepID=A0A839IJT0_9GAMM|nr:PLP-dependent aminotransferase family protein [Oceanospirillum sediminis]MBB1485161.1 PLP-dependent aminotransferase family protein [Oceanospirillum sediminis]